MWKGNVSKGVDIAHINSEMNTSSTLELTRSDYDFEKEKEAQNGLDGQKRNPTSNFEALVHVLKSSLGTGILAIPSGFKNGGMIIGLFGTAIVGFLCAHCTYLMVHCSQEMCRRLKKPYLGYTETIVAVFENCANKKYRSLATSAKASVEVFIFFTYYGANTAYIILVADSFREIVENHLHPNLDLRVYIVVVGMPIYFVGIVKSMKYLAPFSILANILLIVGLSITFYFLLTDIPPIEKLPKFAPIERLPVFFSTVLFGLEGIGTMLPIENSMKTPKNFLGCPGVLTIAMTIVVVLYTTVGFFGYLKYEEGTKGSITLNLPNDGLAESVKGLVALAIFFTYGLQLTASVDVVWKRLESKLPVEKKRLAYFIVRSVMIAGTVLLAVAVPKLGPVISLIGAFGLSMCGIFFPAVIDTLVLWDEGYGPLKWKLWKNSILVIMAILALCAGTVTSIQDIVKAYT